MRHYIRNDVRASANDPELAPSPFAGARGWIIGFAFWTALGLLMFSYEYLDVFVRERVEPFQIKLIEQLTGAWGVAMLTPFIFRVTRRLRGGGTLLLMHLPAFVLFSILHTSWNWGSRVVLFPVFGLGAYDYGLMPLRYLMEAGMNAILYLMIAAFVLLLDHYRRARMREVRLAGIEQELARARLTALESRLQPHFLYNALHTISATMYEDVRVADRMLTRLADLLRRTLREEATEVPLAEELETASLWTSIMEARFGDRLTVEYTLGPGADEVLVPPLILQPLLENAVRHGERGPEHPLRIVVRAARQGDELVLEVEDNGPGLSLPANEALDRGVGLTTTRGRLEALHPGRHRLELEAGSGEDAAGGADAGTIARIVVPWRTAR